MVLRRLKTKTWSGDVWRLRLESGDISRLTSWSWDVSRLKSRSSNISRPRLESRDVSRLKSWSWDVSRLKSWSQDSVLMSWSWDTKSWSWSRKFGTMYTTIVPKMGHFPGKNLIFSAFLGVRLQPYDIFVYYLQQLPTSCKNLKANVLVAYCLGLKLRSCSWSLESWSRLSKSWLHHCLQYLDVMCLSAANILQYLQIGWSVVSSTLKDICLHRRTIYDVLVLSYLCTWIACSILLVPY